MTHKVSHPERMRTDRMLTLAAMLGAGVPVYAPPRHVGDGLHQVTFNMNQWFKHFGPAAKANPDMAKLFQHGPPKCDTVACMGGHCNILWGNGSLQDEQGAAASLGLDYADANRLFYPNTVRLGKWDDITPKKAARVLRHLVKTGEIDWTLR